MNGTQAKRWSVGRLLITIAVSLALWALVATFCLMIGSTGSFGWPAPRTLNYRIENVGLASLIGAALGASGVVYQAILRNPLADPYLLGVSTGASLAAYIWRFTALTVGVFAGVSQQGFAFGGAIIAVSVVFLLAGFRGRLEPLTLLLVGVIVNAVNASLYLLLNSIKRDLPGDTSMAFLIGGIQTNLDQSQIIAAGVVVAMTWMILLSLSGQLNVAVLSEGEAISLGVRINRLRWLALLLASLMTASAVAISGPIGFVGLVCPHLSRLVVGHDHRRLFPVATATGAGLLALADAASRLLASQNLAQTYLPVGVLTGLLGGPFFLLLLWQSRRQLS
ncbi:MAG TPA: iron ABC transporter permease [Tepidisphaeraceae bacterium]|nr:iron ABC transporter permease [Tepidisphaeraceae bacterium]